MANATENHSADVENDSSGENYLSATEGKPLDDLVEEIQSSCDIIKDRYSQRPLQNRIICSVGRLLRGVNSEAYTPKFFIIGPLRSYNRLIEESEMEKRMHLASFLERATTKPKNLKDFCNLIKDHADEIYRCYEETFLRTWNFQSHEFKQNTPGNDGRSDGRSEWLIELVLVDASFIIELFLRAYKKDNKLGKHDIKVYRRDLFLANNQLPFFIIKNIYELAFGTGDDPDYPSFLHLTCHFFSPYFNHNISIRDITSPKHCSDEYRKMLLNATHFADLLRTLQLPPLKIHEESLESSGVQGEYLYSALLLRQAGVRFKVSESRCLLDIEFNQKTGELRIPSLRVDEWTESFFRNLMAWEQSCYPQDTAICDYIFLMEYLIKSTGDVDLLVRKRIIINKLGNNKAVVTLFNYILKYVTQPDTNRYSVLFQKLNAYNAVPHHSWRADLKHQYFSTVWRGVATIAATILLLLTLIQSVCSIISLT